MPKGANQKLKLYYLSKIMLEKTDEDHYLTISEIKTELARYGVTADRKSLYDDLQQLEVLGLEVTGEPNGKSYHYHVTGKQFEIAELKLLVDAIQSSKFITQRKSSELIHKLEQQASRFEANQLNRQVMMTGRVKTMNESIYYNVDAIHSAINENKKIRFEYLNWTLKKTLEPRFDGTIETSPWALLWDDENYYLVGYSTNNEQIKHYRVDKMRRIQTMKEMRDGKETFEKWNPAKYAKAAFGMFGGETTNVKLRCENAMAGVIIDRFGTDIIIKPDGKEHFTTNVDVAVSAQFFAWVFGLAGRVVIAGPQDVKRQMKEAILTVNRAFER
ncbi:MAG: WYL domain-containing protein [Lachnospiraceae bacterium]|nr:WYL domain-containing protein [Lachnospiraceae bacterium]